jgi:(p)ppGpp synthase/HD superfamily hydrolase
MKFFNKTYELAVWGHSDQLRSDGKPYITHIDAVINNVKELIKYRNDFWKSEFTDEQDYELLLSVAAGHDTFLEDNPEKFEKHPEKLAELKDIGLSIHPDFFSEFWTAIRAISKKPKGQEEYIDYILRVKENPYARLVKISDLIHNMSDLKPSNLRDKYSLTKYFLEN